MRITDKNFEMDIIKTILSKSKEPNEKLRTMIKLENNNKLSKRILIIRADGELKNNLRFMTYLCF